MISLKAEQLALVNSVIAMVARDEQVRWKYAPHTKAFDEIGVELGCLISVYDIKRVRFVKFDFDDGSSVEVEVGPAPEPVVKDGPDGDPPPNTTGPVESPRLAAAA